MKIVIIGSGAAAIAAAKALRLRDAEIEINVYTEEKVLPYFRPSLSFAIAQPVPQPRPMNPAGFYEEKKIGMHLNMTATALDRVAKTVAFADGSSVSYDFLLLATGAHCFIPPIPGINLPEVVALRGQADLDKLMGLLTRSRRVMVIGCGVLGLEMANSLLSLGHQVTMVESAPTILCRQLDAVGSVMYSRVLDKVPNLEVRLNSGVTEIYGPEQVTGVMTREGVQLDCDLILVSAGTRSNIALAKDSGLPCGRGITVDDHMRTADPAVFAAGDCAEVQCHSFGLWEPALDQGKVAAANMLGEPAEFICKIYGATLNAFGTKLFSIGCLQSDEVFEEKDEGKGIYRKIFFGGGNVIGGILLGDTTKAMPLTKAINQQMSRADAEAAGIC